MYKSTYFTIMIALTFVVLAATVTFQALEMDAYNLFSTLFK